MLRKLLIILLIVSGLALPTAASACWPMPFDSHISRATNALRAKKLEPAVREQAERWLAAARDGKGPRWHGERQQALNELLRVLSLPAAARAPLDELSPQEQKIQLRDEAEGTIARIDELMPKSKLSDADLAKVKQLRRQAADLVAARKLTKAIETGNEALLALGVSFPRC